MQPRHPYHPSTPIEGWYLVRPGISVFSPSCNVEVDSWARALSVWHSQGQSGPTALDLVIPAAVVDPCLRPHSAGAAGHVTDISVFLILSLARILRERKLPMTSFQILFVCYILRRRTGHTEWAAYLLQLTFPHLQSEGGPALCCIRCSLHRAPVFCCWYFF